MNRHYNRFRRFCALLVGLVFVLSGTWKLMDPIGTSLIVGEYWNFLHLGFMRWANLPLAVALGLLETFVGIALTTGVFRKLAALVSLALCAFFTLLTSLLLIFNPDMDCGCFGEHFHLTHLQSFLKNIVLSALSCLAFLPLRDLGKARKLRLLTACMAAVLSVLLLCWSLLMLPFKDYTDMKPGTRLTASLSDEATEQPELKFVYEKDGKQRAFSLEEELPDSSWTFVGTEHLSQPLGTADLSLRNPLTNEYEDQLAAGKAVLVISTFRSNKLKAEAGELLDAFASYGGTAIHLSSEASGDAYNYLCDRRSILSLNRSDGGATLIQDGVIVRKWSSAALPSLQSLVELSEAEADDNLADVDALSSLLQNLYFIVIFAVLLI